MSTITSGTGIFSDYSGVNPDNTLNQVGDQNDPAYHNNTIARWAAPLFKDYDSPTEIPLLAYHISGIDRVEFQLNNGPVVTVSDQSYNATIGATCYNITLSGDIPDNEYNELRAIVYPNSGYPQVLQGEAMGDQSPYFSPLAPGLRNLKHGHHSYFFATNFFGSLPKKEFYVNASTGNDVDNGTTPTTPKKTIESVLIAAGGAAKEVDGLVIYLMDNNGQRVDYDLGTIGYTFSSGLRVNNLKRYVTFTPYQNANVTLRKRGNDTGLALNKYRFLNLKIDQPSRSIITAEPNREGRIFSFKNPNRKIFTNQIKGITYSVATSQYGGVHVLVENCNCNFNHQPLFDWAKTRPSYVRIPGFNDRDPYGNQIPADVEINVTVQNVGETTVDFRQRAAKWFYQYSGLTYNPNWRTDTPLANKNFVEGLGNTTVIETADCTSMCLIGSTFSDMQAFTKGGQVYFMNKCHAEKIFEDCWRDVGCGVKCTASDIIGNPFNVGVTLTQDVVGAGSTGSGVLGHAHTDILQIFPGSGGQSRNRIYYEMSSRDYYSQGPFFEAGKSFVGFTLDPNLNISDQYEQRWAEYNFPSAMKIPPAGTSSSMIRDIVLDKCTFMQNNKSNGALIAIIRCLHGNFIFQDSIIGKTDEESEFASYRYNRAFDGILSGAALEIQERQFHTPLRPSLIKRCRTGSTDPDLDKLFFKDTSFNISYDTTHGRKKWITEGRLDYWVTDPLSSEASGSFLIYDQRAETTTQPETAETKNHPITISLTTTDIQKDISWASKDTFYGVTHGADSFYSANSIVQIPNYLERIKEITDPPPDNPDIGPSRSNEASGNSTEVPNQGGVYVTGGTIDVTLNPTIDAINSMDVRNLAIKFQSDVRVSGGKTFAVILHGKTIPSTEFGEYKYVAEPEITSEEWGNQGYPSNLNVQDDHFEDFYKRFSYISFHSKEAGVTNSLTSNQISFRKSPHHTYIDLTRNEMDGLSLSNGATGLSYVDLVTGISSTAAKIGKLQALATGITCNINSYGEFTSASKTNSIGTNPQIITCTNNIRKFVGLIENGNKIVLQGMAPSGTNSIFNFTKPRYDHNGVVASNDINYLTNLDPSIPRYIIPDTQSDPQKMHLRFINPINTGNKNLLAYKVPIQGTRLFGATTSIGITAGSYVRISGSVSNNGIYQVLSIADGIDGDIASNTKTDGSTEYQYLELSRAIVAEEQAVGKNIRIENVSHLPILHIKYRTPNP
jgi:hypothetical protein